MSDESSTAESEARSLASPGAWLLVPLALAYALGLALFPPRVTLISDESQYIRQAVAFASGRTKVQVRDPKTWKVRKELPSQYPPGTSLLQTPFVVLGGWRGAAWASALALFAMMTATGALLRRMELPALYAALIPLFVPAAVLGRTGMSDVPSGAITALGWWYFIRGPRQAWVWCVAGFLAGFSTLLRDSNPLFFLPLFAGAVIRREPWLLLTASGLAGLCVRSAIVLALQGTVFGVPIAYYPFTLDGFHVRVLLYVAALTFLVPGGLVAAFQYRGRRWPELLATTVSALLFFSLYSYAGQFSGFVRTTILAPRYFIPLLPALAVAVAWLVHRAGMRPKARASLEWVLFLGALTVSIAVHPVMALWAQRQGLVVDAITQATSAESVVVTELGATAKYINELYGSRAVIGRDQVTLDELAAMRERRNVQLVFLDRSDSEYWRTMALGNSEFAAAAASRCKLAEIVDLQATASDRLRIWDVKNCD